MAAKVDLDKSSAQAPFKYWPVKGPDIEVERRNDGCILLKSRHQCADEPRSISHLFVKQASAFPERSFLQQRLAGRGPWRSISYGEALRAARGIAQHLIERQLSANDGVMVLSGNSIEHALVTLGCYLSGVPVIPISPAFSLLTGDHGRLRHCFNATRPRIIFAQSGGMFAPAFATLRGLDSDLTLVTAQDHGPDSVALDVLLGTEPTGAVENALERIGPNTVAKYLFTSGSTGMPKAVPQTHGMMTALVAGLEGLNLPESEQPGLVRRTLEWMPWSHISAGNVGFNGVISSGGTVFLDDGKPIPGLFDITMRNLREVEPVVFGSAPIAFGMLASAMENDVELRRAFFKNLQYMAYGGATLSNDIYERLQALAVLETGHRIPLTTMYGATETQGISMTHWVTERVGLIGLPLPGLTMKLVPNGSKLEVRVKGATVMPGYLGDPQKTAASFDEEGFYKLGDAVRFLDDNDPSQGLVFDGRVVEDFKLDSGTWVSVGVLRPAIVAACSPYVLDAIITGQDQPFVGALLWPSGQALEQFRSSDGTFALDPLQDAIRTNLASYNASAKGSSRRIERFAILTEPPSLAIGEMTDKGYVNQRLALESRALIVAGLYQNPPPAGVVSVA
ncbi:MAG: AMP-binding protein [Steroidobacteraceae bacterium]